jgi:hypothetical protein
MDYEVRKGRGVIRWLGSSWKRKRITYHDCRSFRRYGKRSGNRQQRVQDRKDRHGLRGIVRSRLAHRTVHGLTDMPRTTSGHTRHRGTYCRIFSKRGFVHAFQ